MAGETIKTEAVCLDIRPWSQTSHVVTWLTPVGKVTTVVKGAVRAKSAFLGQYDLNYTCDILYYVRAKGELHPLRECAPSKLRETLRDSYRALALAGYFRRLVTDLAPAGPDCGRWYDGLVAALDECARGGVTGARAISLLVRFELTVLALSGVAPDFSGCDPTAEWSSFSIETGSFSSEGRCIRVSREVAAFLSDPKATVKNFQTPLDAARVIGVFYQFHVDCAVDVRRSVLGMISEKEEGTC